MYPSSRATKILNLSLEQKYKSWGTYPAVETAHVINRRKRKFDPFSVDEDNDNNEVENNMSLQRNEPLSDDISLNLNANHIMSNGHSSLFRSDIETINKSRDGEVEEAILRKNNNEEVRSEAEERMLKRKECWRRKNVEWR